jgi:hypothetical protein
MATARSYEHDDHDARAADSGATAEERWARLDAAARRRLGMSGDEFVRGLETGRLVVTDQGRSVDDTNGSAIHVVESTREIGDEDDLSDIYMSDEEFDEMFDQIAQRLLGISGDEFIRGWDAGEYPDWDPEFAELVALLPYRGKAILRNDDAADVELPLIVELTFEESRALFDQQAREWLGMSGEEFARRLRDGEIEDPDRTSVIILSMTMPRDLR